MADFMYIKPLNCEPQIGELQYVDYISIKLLKKKNLGDLRFGGNFLDITPSSTIHEK